MLEKSNKIYHFIGHKFGVAHMPKKGEDFDILRYNTDSLTFSMLTRRLIALSLFVNENI